MTKYSTNQKGLALMMVLWILILLGALATEFAYSMRTEINTTKNYNEDIESYYLAKAGINMAVAELYKNVRFHSIHPEYGFIKGIQIIKNIEDSNLESEGQKINTSKKNTNNLTSLESLLENVDSEPDFEITNRTNIQLGNGFINYQISDENGKININRATREVLVKTLEASGVEKGDLNYTITDSILDWIDVNENHKLNGAESDYYLSLDPPYESKNDLIDSLDELLKVRGMTKEILYGSEEKENPNLEEPIYLGLINFLTIQNVKSFNPNTAETGLLPIFFTDLQTQAILEARERKGYFNDSKSTHFKVKSTGFIKGSNTKRTIVAIFEKSGASKDATLLIKYWNDNSLQS